MCYAKPGPRCSGHAYDALVDAKINHYSDPSEETRNELKKATIEFFGTPKGFKMLEEKIESSYHNPTQQQQLEHTLGQLRKLREKKLEAYKAEYRTGTTPEPHNTNFEPDLRHQQQVNETERFSQYAKDPDLVKVDDGNSETVHRGPVSYDDLDHYDQKQMTEEISGKFGRKTRDMLQNSTTSDPHDPDNEVMVKRLMERHLESVESSMGVDLGTDKHELANAYTDVVLTRREYTRTAIEAIDPPDCGCTDCLIGESSDYDPYNPNMDLLMKSGILIDRR